MRKLKKVCDHLVDADTPAGRRFALGVQVLILFSLLSFALSTTPQLSLKVQRILWWEQFAVILLFTVEYLVRLIAAPNKSKYIFSFFGLIDLLSILPFYVQAGIDLRGLRAIRLVHIFQILKLGRYSKAIQRFHSAFLLSKEQIALFFSITTILLFVGAVGIYYFERDAQPDKFVSIFHSLWWSVITLTTVGYGDIYPVTIGGRFFTIVVLMVGIGIVAVPAAIVTSALSQAQNFEREETESALRAFDNTGKYFKFFREQHHHSECGNSGSALQLIVDKLRSQGQRIALAESCTGGLVAARLASVPGVSEVFCGSVVSYRENAKQDWLSISSSKLQTFSPVSPEVTLAMACAVLAETPEASLAAAVTGHLGPAAPTKLDGTMYVAVVCRDPTTRSIRTLIEDEHLLSASPRESRQIEAADFVLRRVEKVLDTENLPDCFS